MVVVWYRSEYNLDDHSGHQIGRKEKIIMFSSSTLSLAAAHHPFTISGPATTFTDTLQGPLKFPNRMFDGVDEWLVGSLISVLGIFATAIFIKVSSQVARSLSIQ